MAGIRESRDEGMLKDIYFAFDGGRSVADGIEISVWLDLVVIIL